MTTDTEEIKSDVKKLNEFLKNELSAVETYQQCIDKASDPNTSQRLTELKQSHQSRVGLLKQRIQELGGKPVDGSGAWGGFARMVEGGARLFGENAAISVLKEGEDRGRNEYERDVKRLSAENQTFIKNSILPEQLRSHEELSQLRSVHH